MSSRALRVISSFNEKIVSSALSMRMALSQISLTHAKREDGAKRAFMDKKTFLSLNCREWREEVWIDYMSIVLNEEQRKSLLDQVASE